MKEASAPPPSANFQHQTVVEELAFLRKTLRDLIAAYAGHLEGEITALLSAVKADAEPKRKLPPARAHDLRDMLALLRDLELKPAKGRRRDLKKIENLAEELRRIVERWA